MTSPAPATGAPSDAGPVAGDPAAHDIAFEPGSFRDPSGGVFYRGDRVFRFFTARAASEFRGLLESGALAGLIERGAVVGTRVLERADAGELYQALPQAALIVEHDRMPFVSYSYEWPFEMLRAAALHHLTTLREALDGGLSIKDATSFNVQFAGPSPLLIDVASFEPYVEGRPWAGYAQFCRMFLNPLLLQAFTGVRYQSWLRSAIDGIEPSDLRALLSLRHKLRRDVLVHVVAQSWFERSLAGVAAEATRDVSNATVSRKALQRLLGGLERSIAGLKRRKRRSHWLRYESDCHYEDEAAAAKQRFVERVLAERTPASVLDLGCNLGQFSLIAARHAGHVVAVDGDEEAVGALYERVTGDEENASNVLPLVMDCLNPSPDQGWAQTERRGLAARGPADFVLCLALVHHLSLTGNVPVERLIDWLASCGRGGVVEFVPKSDPMAQRLLATRPDVVSSYEEGAFRRALGARFHIDAVERLPASGRALYAFSELR